MFINLKILLSIVFFSFSWYSYSENLFEDYDKYKKLTNSENLFEDYDKYKELTKDLVKPEKVKLTALYCENNPDRILAATDGIDLYGAENMPSKTAYSYDLSKLKLLKQKFKLEKEKFLFVKSNASFYREAESSYGEGKNKIKQINVVQKKRNLNVFAIKNERKFQRPDGTHTLRTRIATFDFESPMMLYKKYREDKKKVIKGKNCRVETIFHYVFKDFNKKELL